MQFNHIRRMTLADLAQIYALEKNCHSHPWSLQVIRDCIELPNYECLLLEENNIILGFIIASVGANECQLQNICVANEYRRLGYGKLLLDYLYQIIVSKNITSIFLEVRESNFSAQKLYQSVGYQQVGVRKSYYPTTNGRENGIIYRLDISNP